MSRHAFPTGALLLALVDVKVARVVLANVILDRDLHQALDELRLVSLAVLRPPREDQVGRNGIAGNLVRAGLIEAHQSVLTELILFPDTLEIGKRSADRIFLGIEVAAVVNSRVEAENALDLGSRPSIHATFD